MFSKLFPGLFPSNSRKLDPEKIPKHIAVIMDGNGRWATGRGLPRAAGHKAGIEALKKTVKTCVEIGVKYLTVYAFSTENWERPKNEVDFLMSLFKESIDREMETLQKAKVRIKFLGRTEDFPQELQKKMRSAEERTQSNANLDLNIMVNYGGRAEILDAVAKVVEGVKEGQPLSEELVAQNLYTAGIPDPDLLVRTAYERRISNFLLWQVAYSELYFTKTLWPDFGGKELFAAIKDYQARVRKFGRVLN
jgi:undecaprenyl diphosphate synthase